VAVGCGGVAVGAPVVGVGASAAATTLVAGSLPLPQAGRQINTLQTSSPNRHDSNRFNRFNSRISSMSNTPGC
jgi:hypothetical protein